LFGIMLGIFACVSLFELIHRTVEVERHDICSVIYDELMKTWHPDFGHSLRITYKLFAWPVKQMWIYFTDSNFPDVDYAIYEEGEWQFGYRGGTNAP